jgi:hypothetical protein
MVNRTGKLTKGIVAIAIASTAAFALNPSAAADPAAPQPGPAPQLPGLPGLPALTELSPIIQQAAADPQSASQLLMAAASAFVGNPSKPAESKNVASSVNQFVQEPQAHVPPVGVVPGAEAHLPTGIDPVHAAGPDAAPPASAPAPTPAAAPVSLSGPPAAAPAPAPPSAAPAGAPAPAAAPVPPAPPAAAPVPPAPPAAAPVPAGDAAAPPAAAPPAPAGGAPAPAAATPGFGPDAPPTQDFMYPSIGQACLSDGGNSIAPALSVAGPAKIPSPGPAAGQTAYVFTAVGTAGPADVQKLPLNVTWVNLTTGKSGSATLKPRPDINPDGPTTLTAIADTGSGSIMSTIFGQVTTKEKQCQFMPTIGSTVVP